MQLRPFQRQAVEALLSRPGHVLCVAPTGSGKSLIYERYAAAAGAKVLLVSPLVALAEQQLLRLREIGLSATREAPQPGGAKTDFWILSPESLEYEGTWRALTQWGPECLVVDECHCLWEWGQGFRPAFQRIPELFGRVPSLKRSLWLTATLPQIARQWIRTQIAGSWIEMGEFAFPQGLSVRVSRVPWAVRADHLLERLSFWSGQPGIVFCPTRGSASRVHRLVQAACGSDLALERVVLYHAGFSSDERRALERQVREHEVDIIVATSAFGMGMDYRMLRWVLLWQTPLSPLSLAQALGRVGRAGDPGVAEVMWDFDDLRTLDWASRSSPLAREQVEATIALLASEECRQSALARYFEHGAEGLGASQPAEPPEVARYARCGRCDVCVRSDSWTSRSIMPRMLTSPE